MSASGNNRETDKHPDREKHGNRNIGENIARGTTDPGIASIT